MNDIFEPIISAWLGFYAKSHWNSSLASNVRTDVLFYPVSMTNYYYSIQYNPMQ